MVDRSHTRACVYFRWSFVSCLDRIEDWIYLYFRQFYISNQINKFTNSETESERDRQRDQSQHSASANFRISNKKKKRRACNCVRLVSTTTTTNFIISLCSHCRSPYSSLAILLVSVFFFSNFWCECTNSSLKRVRFCSVDLSTLLLNFIAHHQSLYFEPRQQL